MHPTSVFSWTDRSVMLRFVRWRSFVTLVDPALRVAQVPVVVDEEHDRLLMHFSRGNRLARALPSRVVAVVCGVDGYVSPDWYESAEQVPTWNYESVEIEGTLTATDDALLQTTLVASSAEHEARLTGKAPWTLDKLTPETLAKLKNAIVGASLSLDVVRGTRKLSQNRAPNDAAAVRSALAASPRSADRALLERMMDPDGSALPAWPHDE